MKPISPSTGTEDANDGKLYIFRDTHTNNIFSIVLSHYIYLFANFGNLSPNTCTQYKYFIQSMI